MPTVDYEIWHRATHDALQALNADSVDSALRYLTSARTTAESGDAAVLCAVAFDTMAIARSSIRDDDAANSAWRFAQGCLDIEYGRAQSRSVRLMSTSSSYHARLAASNGQNLAHAVRTRYFAVLEHCRGKIERNQRLASEGLFAPKRRMADVSDVAAVAKRLHAPGELDATDYWTPLRVAVRALVTLKPEFEINASIGAPKL